MRNFSYELTYQLFADHGNRTFWKRPMAWFKNLFQWRPETFKNDCIVRRVTVKQNRTRYASDPLKPTKNIVFIAQQGCCVIRGRELDRDLFVGKYIAGSKDIALNRISLSQCWEERNHTIGTRTKFILQAIFFIYQGRWHTCQGSRQRYVVVWHSRVQSELIIQTPTMLRQ